ncbi:hypothetical protein [uncultured Muribaculum sp.]|uniref:hypothetical protein n=1 Tax=uncultured Muribaculum sp. TaxID=1918613 RepID=UPI0025F36BCA|nr:hypothetical protein [uncultured Muribaculum sp.]
MKAMVGMRRPDVPFGPETPVTVVPDSAILRTGRPWFIPPFATRWTLETVLALRISRLGHCIGAKFAHRYFDAVTLGVMPRPYPHDPSNGMLDAFDGALIIGDWMPLTDDGTIVAFTPTGTMDLGPQIEGARDMIAHLSSFATMKTGDVVGICTFLPVADPSIDLRWEGGINGKRLLSFNVK